MRIIRPGKVIKGFEGVWNCSSCHAQWEMTSADPEPHSTSDQREGSFYTMKCPTCGTNVSRNVRLSTHPIDFDDR